MLLPVPVYVDLGIKQTLLIINNNFCIAGLMQNYVICFNFVLHKIQLSCLFSSL